MLSSQLAPPKQIVIDKYFICFPINFNIIHTHKLLCSMEKWGV